MAQLLSDKVDLIRNKLNADRLDRRLASLFAAIKCERTPERLLKLAVNLQEELAARHPRNPH